MLIMFSQCENVKVWPQFPAVLFEQPGEIFSGDEAFAAKSRSMEGLGLRLTRRLCKIVTWAKFPCSRARDTI
jgi:hypothetical protein